MYLCMPRVALVPVYSLDLRSLLSTCTLILQIYRPQPAASEDMTKFHAEDYIEFLQSVTPEKKVPYCIYRSMWCFLLLVMNM